MRTLVGTYLAVLAVLVFALVASVLLNRREDLEAKRVWAGLLLGWLSAGLIGGGGLATATNWRMISGSVPAEGRVIGLARDGKWTRAPVIRYEVAGQGYEFQAGSSSNPPAYSVGDVVAVRYRPDHPERGYLNSFGELWLLPLILAALGILSGSLGVLLLRDVVMRPTGSDSAVRTIDQPGGDPPEPK